MRQPILSSHKKIVAAAVKTGAAYVIIACSWILFSDNLLLLFIDRGDIDTFALTQTLKGIFFVLITGLLFTSVMYHKLRQLHHTQEALREHGDNYKMLFELTPHPMWLYDPVTRAFLEVNKAAVETYGYSRDEFLSMTTSDLLSPEDTDQKLQPVQDTPAVRRHHRKDGSICIVEVISHKLLFFGKEVFLAQIHDITEQKLAEDKLRRSEERYRNIVDTAHEGIWLIDTNGVTTFVNRRMTEILGYTEEEMTGRPVFEFMDEDAVKVAEQNLEKRRQGIYESHDFRFRHKDGRDVWTLVSASPLEDDGGRLIGNLGMLTDITARRTTEEELRKSEQKFRDVLDNSIDVIYKLSVGDGSYDYISPSASKVLSVSPDELLRHGTPRLIELVHEEDRPRVQQHYRRLSALSHRDETPLSLEYRIRHTGDGYRWVRETCTGVHNGANLLIAIVGTIRDITSRKEAEAVIHRMNEELEQRVAERTMQLEVSNKELEAFSYSVSHDLRAPLRSIDGFSKILLEDYFERLESRGQNYLQRVRAASQRMGQLIDDLLTLSRVTRSNINRVELNISDLAASLLQEYRAAQPERNVQFHSNPELVTCADANLMRIMLDNLLNNAWKFTSRQEDAVIELNAVEHNDTYAYVVRDNGVGFDMAYAHKLFGAFQRLHPVSEFEGTGIGLATVQRIVHRHGGRVWAEGQPGRGAAFYFTLPT